MAVLHRIENDFGQGNSFLKLALGLCVFQLIVLLGVLQFLLQYPPLRAHPVFV